MNENRAELRTQHYNRLARRAFIGFVLSFGALFVPLLLPFARRVGMLFGVVAILALLLTFMVLIYAILARELPVWRQNRWRFSVGMLFHVITTVAMMLGTLIALAREASGLHVMLALGLYFVVSTAVYTIINWRARIRHFNDMHEQGRYLEWGTVAEHLACGNGTALVAPCYNVSTVWWTDREVISVVDAQAAIDTDAFITLCPKQRWIARWLRATFPEAPIVEVPTFFGLQSRT